VSLLRISAGTTDITPTKPLPLGGFAKRTAPFNRIASRLEANVLVLKRASSRVIFVSTDLLYPGNPLRARIAECLELPKNAAELFLCASHTHNAPMTEPEMPRLGVADEGYLQFVSERIAALIKAIGNDESPGECSYHEGLAHHSINRRLMRLRVTKWGLSRSASFGPNPRGERDEWVRILKFSDSHGKPIAAIWNYACHPSGFFDLLAVSAEYPGVVRDRLRAELGNIPILFFQGFSGDVRPPFFGKPAGIKALARRALLGPQFRIPDQDEWNRWASDLADCVAGIARSPDRKIEIAEPSARLVEIPGREFAAGVDANKSLVWHLIDCGGVRILGINAEPVSEYRRLVEPSPNGIPLLTVGCLDHTQCYLPTDAMIGEGGYEVEGFRPLLDFDAHFLARIQDNVTGEVKKALA